MRPKDWRLSHAKNPLHINRTLLSIKMHLRGCLPPPKEQIWNISPAPPGTQCASQPIGLIIPPSLQRCLM